MFQRALASLEAKKRTLNSDQVQLRGQLAHVSAQHDALRKKIRDRLIAEGIEDGNGRSRLRGRGRRRPRPGGPAVTHPPGRASAGTGTDTQHSQTSAPATHAGPTAPADPATLPDDGPADPTAAPRDPGRGDSTGLPDDVGQTGAPRRTRGVRHTGAATRTGAAPPPGSAPPPGATPAGPARGPIGPRPGAHGTATRRTAAAPRPGSARVPLAGQVRSGGAETTTGSMQTVLLSLGGFLLAGAAVVLTMIAFANVGAAGRMALLTLTSLAALALPLELARRRLTATAETVATVALLLVLLDGYVAWSLKLFGANALGTSRYFGLICLVTAVISIGYHAASRLVAPRFAALVLLQPVAPLLAYDRIHGLTGLALTAAAVAALDLGFGAGWWRLPLPARARPANHRNPASGGAATGAPPADRTTTEATPADTSADAPPADSSAADRADGPVDRPAGGPVDEEYQPVHRVETAQLTDTVLRDFAWVLFGLSYLAGLVCSVTALASTTTLAPTLRAALALLLVAAVGVGGGLVWRRHPVPEFTAGAATLALIFTVARVGTAAAPGYALLLTAVAVTIAAAIVPLVPAFARRGPMIAGGAAAIGTTALLIGPAIRIIVAPLDAALPVWKADLTGYPATLIADAGDRAWQVLLAAVLLTAASAVLLPPAIRLDGVVIGTTLTMLVVPATVGMSWLIIPIVTIAVAVAIVTVALNAPTPHTAIVCVACSIGLGGYAAATSLTRPAATALALALLTVAGGAIAFAPRAPRDGLAAELVAQRVTDVAGGGALFALPGAAAAGTAAMLEGDPTNQRAPIILVVSFIALAASVGFAALAQLTRSAGRRERPDATATPLLAGATLATIAVVTAAFLAPGTGGLDIAVGLLMAAATGLLWIAPSIDSRQSFGADLRGADAAAAALTIATIGAVMRAAALASPGVELATVAALVLLAAIASQALPAQARRGPVVGSGIVGFATAVYAGGFALVGTVGVIRAATPVWHASLGTAWQRNAAGYLDYGAQIPLTLLLLAAAAVIALPRGQHDSVAASLLVIAITGAPVGLGLDWTGAVLLSWFAATVLGVAAALAHSPRSAYVRLSAAGALAVVATLASLVSPGATAATLFGIAISATLVATLAGMLGEARARRDHAEIGHLGVVGGAATAAALASLPGAVVGIAAEAGRSVEFRTTAALAAVAAGLALAGIACRRLPGYAPFVSIGVALAGIGIVIASIPTSLSTTVFAATVALFGVLAELLRASVRTSSPTVRPVRRFRPDASALPNRVWRSVDDSGGFGAGVALTAGVPAAIAIIEVAPAIVAALLGPYRWITDPWTGTQYTGADLGWFQRWVGDDQDVLAAVLLTIAAAFVAVGLGGDAKAISNRAVAVITPGLAVTLLITPAALHWPYPAQPTAALLVATVAGLSVALTPPPPLTRAAAPLWAGRRLAFVIAVLAAGTGMAGSLATESQTIAALGCSVLVGLVGALGGRTWFTRIVGWQVAAGAAELLALAAGLAAGLPLSYCAYPVLAVSGVLLGFAGLLPRILEGWAKPQRRVSIGREIAVIETIAYAGALASVGMTFGTPANTAVVCFALGAILGVAATRPGRGDQQRTILIIGSVLAELVAIWLMLVAVRMSVPEAYTLPFAAAALGIGVLNLRQRPDLGSWVAYGPALVAGFAPTLIIVLTSDTSAARRVLLITAAVLTVAIGAVRRRKAPAMIGAGATAIAVLHELVLLGRYLPWPILLVLFTAAGVFLVGLGATYEKRRQNMRRLRGAYGRMR